MGQNKLQKRTIELKEGQKLVSYDEEANVVNYITRHGVSIECAIPEDWGLTRVFQFMESLYNAELV